MTVSQHVQHHYPETVMNHIVSCWDDVRKVSVWKAILSVSTVCKRVSFPESEFHLHQNDLLNHSGLAVVGLVNDSYSMAYHCFQCFLFSSDGPSISGLWFRAIGWHGFWMWKLIVRTYWILMFLGESLSRQRKLSSVTTYQQEGSVALCYLSICFLLRNIYSDFVSYPM